MTPKRKAKVTGAVALTGVLAGVCCFIGVLLINWFAPGSGLDALIVSACIWIATTTVLGLIHLSMILGEKEDATDYPVSELLGHWLLKPRWVKKSPKEPIPTSAVGGP